MKMTEGKPSDITLIGLTVLSVIVFFLAEKTAEPERQPYYDKKLKAAKTALLASQAIKDYGKTLGIALDLFRKSPRGPKCGVSVKNLTPQLVDLRLTHD